MEEAYWATRSHSAWFNSTYNIIETQAAILPDRYNVLDKCFQRALLPVQLPENQLRIMSVSPIT